MGTSGSYGGPGNGTPLVPSWVDDPVPWGAPTLPASAAPTGPDGVPGVLPSAPIVPITRPQLPQQAPMPSRFTAPRTNFTKFARSGGSARGSLGRALSGYVSTAAGGARQATRRMGASRHAGARLYSFLADAQARGPVEALRALNLGALAGRPLEEVFLGLADYVCPESGSVDDGIARDAFIDTIADLAGEGITDFDTLTADQMQTVFEIFATHAIEARIFNDIGKNGVKLPADVAAVTRVQDQLHDFVQRAVSDALASARADAGPLTQARALAYVEGVYEAAFDVLQTLGEAAAEND
jgi:hypothetical protein